MMKITRIPEGFCIDSPKKYYQFIVLPNIKKIDESNKIDDVVLAVYNASITLFHLIDWIAYDNIKNKKDHTKAEKERKKILNENQELKHLSDIANGIKHFSLRGQGSIITGAEDIFFHLETDVFPVKLPMVFDRSSSVEASNIPVKDLLKAAQKKLEKLCPGIL